MLRFLFVYLYVLCLFSACIFAWSVILSPHFFLKKDGDIAIASIHPSVHSHKWTRVGYFTFPKFSQMKDIKHIRGIFIRSPGSYPRGRLGLGGTGGQKFYFLKMVILNIKLKGRPGFSDNVYPRFKLMNMGWGQKGQLPLDFFERVGICDGAASNVF